ncbi:hypothetical protein FF1_004096 [Malus domestica]
MLVLISERLLIWKYGSLSIGPYLYVIYGSLFDTRSFPIDFSFSSWDFLCPDAHTARKFRLHYGSKIGRDSRRRWRILVHSIQRGWKPNELSGMV